ncbi:hypothetical protein L6452_39568 [Arctium lappa]|uniref:Uncharacterized protein n=1 Tax=Arctium lappa TaxID=4217 RepID=A0ACB8XT86_ARCLA|nr:hypothetical protein L6452_39568 [Arctium lappa]
MFSLFCCSLKLSGAIVTYEVETDRETCIVFCRTCFVCILPCLLCAFKNQNDQEWLTEFLMVFEAGL